MANINGKLFGFIGQPEPRRRKPVKPVEWKQR